MLSAALLGGPNPSTPSVGSTTPNSSSSGHPPTPPRTPKTEASPFAAAAAAPNLTKALPIPPAAEPKMPSMPPLLSLAAIQDQMSGGAAKAAASSHLPQMPPQHPNILAAQLGKPSLIMPPGPPGPPPGFPPAPPHLSPSAAAAAAAAGIPPHILAAQRVGLLPGAAKSATDYTRYFKRFGSSLECGSLYCKDMNYREHFHCTVPMCKEKVFAKKEEMIRHSKWHSKMDEAFKYGFRRVTPMDDCSDQFPGCQHNKKQTHYHCIHTENCDKCYISTSDVQMHFNYHRKDNAIQREGFLRYRGTDDCGDPACPYRGQKTTHFHCNRGGCNYTFKNKADMEKHKNYHMKDEQLCKDGFKKFMKHEACGFHGCRFTKTVNHIHCIRSGCDYVLHSSGQLYSHKRKHERKDSELAYRKYKMGSGGGGEMNGSAEHASLLMRPDRPPSSENGSVGSSDHSARSAPPASPPVKITSPDIVPGERVPPGLPMSMSNLLVPPPPAGPGPLPPRSPTVPAKPPTSPFAAAGPGAVVPPALPIGGGIYQQHTLPFGSPLPPPVNPTPLVPSDFKQGLMSIHERMPDDVWRTYMLHFESSEGCGFQGRYSLILPLSRRFLEV